MTNSVYKPGSADLPIDQYRKPSSPTWKVTERERKFLNKLSIESVVSSYPSFLVYVIDREKTVVDSLLNEAEKRVWLPPQKLHAYVQWSPTQKTLAAFGLEKSQDVLVATSNAHLMTLPIKKLHELNGSVIYLPTDSRKVVEYEILSAHRRPQDAVLFSGDILNVALVVMRRSPLAFRNAEEGLPTKITSVNPLKIGE